MTIQRPETFGNTGFSSSTFLLLGFAIGHFLNMDVTNGQMAACLSL
jgi:hypothetical protein